MSWLCQTDLLYRLLFLFSKYSHDAEQATRASEKSHEMLAHKHSTLFENYKGLGLKFIFVSIKFFQILICEILNLLLVSVIAHSVGFLCHEMFLPCTNSKWKDRKYFTLFVVEIFYGILQCFVFFPGTQVSQNQNQTLVFFFSFLTTFFFPF